MADSKPKTYRGTNPPRPLMGPPPFGAPRPPDPRIPPAPRVGVVAVPFEGGAASAMTCLSNKIKRYKKYIIKHLFNKTLKG